jgi:hypothetical protein
MWFFFESHNCRLNPPRHHERTGFKKSLAEKSGFFFKFRFFEPAVSNCQFVEGVRKSRFKEPAVPESEPRRLLTKSNTCTAKLLFCHDLNTSIHPFKCAFKGYVIANQEMDTLYLIPLCYVLANVAAIILLLLPVEMLLS